MGIDGLLSFLKPLIKKTHITQFKSKTLGVDILPWLYKGCYSSIMSMGQSELLYQNKNNNGQNKSTSCANYLLEMLNMLEDNQIKIIAVYDGRMLEMKGQTVRRRKDIKQKYGRISQNKLKQNNNKEARKNLARSLRVNETVILESMRILKTKNIPFIVSPYQSDSQLAKLKKLDLIEAVITEDSDLIVYGCNVIFKLDQQGMCDYFDFETVKKDLYQQNLIKLSGLKQFLCMSQFQRIIASVLAGCDYVQSIKGIGIKKAIKMVNNQEDLDKLMQKLKTDKIYGDRIPLDYENKVYKAITIFKNALVFNPITKSLQPLNQINSLLIQTQQFFQTIGVPYEQYLTMNIYLGETSARTLEPRIINPIQMITQKNVQEINLDNLKKKIIDAEMQQQSVNYSESDKIYQNKFEINEQFQLWENTRMQQNLWPMHQVLLNLCVQKITGQN